jgi:acyl-CoA thioester hydrolase
LKRTDFRHVVPLTVHWGDMDSLGHVNNAIYFRYVETGRINYFDELVEHDPTIWGGEGPILADIQCTFLDQLRYPADIEVATRTTRLGEKSMTVSAAVFVKGSETVAATSSAVVVWFDYKKQAAVQIPDRIRKRIRDFEVFQPAE